MTPTYAQRPISKISVSVENNFPVGFHLEIYPSSISFSGILTVTRLRVIKSCGKLQRLYNCVCVQVCRASSGVYTCRGFMRTFFVIVIEIIVVYLQQGGAVVCGQCARRQNNKHGLHLFLNSHLICLTVMFGIFLKDHLRLSSSRSLKSVDNRHKMQIFFSAHLMKKMCKVLTKNKL